MHCAARMEYMMATKDIKMSCLIDESLYEQLKAHQQRLKLSNKRVFTDAIDHFLKSDHQALVFEATPDEGKNFGAEINVRRRDALLKVARRRGTKMHNVYYNVLVAWVRLQDDQLDEHALAAKQLRAVNNDPQIPITFHLNATEDKHFKRVQELRGWSKVNLVAHATTEFLQWYESDKRSKRWHPVSEPHKSNPHQTTLPKSLKDQCQQLADAWQMNQQTVFYNAIRYWLNTHDTELKAVSSSMTSSRFLMKRACVRMMKQLVVDEIVDSHQQLYTQALSSFLLRLLQRAQSQEAFVYRASLTSADTTIDPKSPHALEQVHFQLPKEKHDYALSIAAVEQVKISTLYYNALLLELGQLVEQHQHELPAERVADFHGVYHVISQEQDST